MLRRALAPTKSHHRDRVSVLSLTSPVVCARNGHHSKSFPKVQPLLRIVTNSAVPLKDWFVRTASSVLHTSNEPGQNSARRDFLEARQLSLFQIFDASEYTFDTPAYQRSYCWTEKQVTELLRDLQQAYENDREYFVGSIVTSKVDGSVTQPFILIDGQQRLTTLCIVLAYLQAWSSAQGNTTLLRRVRRMLYIEADPLDPASRSRYRLQLRPADHQFFVRNVLRAFLPQRFVLVRHDAGNNNKSSGRSEDAEVLENESWWRIYKAARCVQRHLHKLADSDIAVQDFIFHVLHKCYCVLLTARDEPSSFRIFATLNSRGLDLSPVDKLKAELLHVLPAVEVDQYSERWLQLEGLLGREDFERLFEYVMLIEMQHEGAGGASMLEYWSSKLSSPADIRSSLTLLFEFGQILREIRQACTQQGPVPGRQDSNAHASTSDGSTSAARRRSQGSTAGGRATTSRQTSSGGSRRRTGTGAGAAPASGAGPGASGRAGFRGTTAQLQEALWFANNFADDTWLPWILEFFRQFSQPEARLQFLQRVEALQVCAELCSDAQQAHARCHQLARYLRGAPAAAAGQAPNANGSSSGVGSSAARSSARVLDLLVLCAEERAELLRRLNSRDLTLDTPRHTLLHLLLRLETPLRDLQDGLQALQVEAVVPQRAPDGSSWRRSKVPVHSGCGDGGAGGADGEGTKYWYEVQRTTWHGRLGNLILLRVPAHVQPPPAGAGYDEKAAYYRECGAQDLFPAFSGPVVSGKYAAHKFSFTECRQRHQDMVQHLVDEFLCV